MSKPSHKQTAFVKSSLDELLTQLYRDGRLTRKAYFDRRDAVANDKSFLEILTSSLFSSTRAVTIPADGGHAAVRLALLELKEIGGATFDLLAASQQKKSTPLRCFVGHRFTEHAEERLRLNLRELFSLFNVEPDYLGFDGAAVDLIPDLLKRIQKAHFCLFDNRETTRPSKPNVYIESGMAFALKKPFIFCHYRREVWPSDFGGVLYLPYTSYRRLFTTLYRKLPGFIASRLKQGATG